MARALDVAFALGEADRMPRKKRTPARAVTLCYHAPPRGKGAGRPLLFAYGLEDLAALHGVSVRQVQRWIRPPKGATPLIDPRDLSSIAEFWLSRRKP
jgi:hypothetical protein